MMVDFGRARRRAILFLTAALIAWAGVNFHLRTRPFFTVTIRRLQPEGPGDIPAEFETAGEKVDINSATAEELTRLKGVGPVLARRITEYRRLNGRFYSTDEIKCVRGVGDGLYGKIKDGISVE